MNEVYEFRRSPGKGAIWLAVMSVVLLLATMLVTGALHLLSTVWVFGAITFGWMLLPKPVYGIRIDADTLTLSAWNQPRPVPLDQIAYLWVAETAIETVVTLVYKDGTQEVLFSADLPEIDTLSAVLAARGIPVRDLDY